MTDRIRSEIMTPSHGTNVLRVDVEMEGCIIWSPLASSLWIDIWASLARSDVDGIEQADILDLPPECSRQQSQALKGKKGGEKGRRETRRGKRGEDRAGSAQACRRAGSFVGPLYG